MTLTNHQKGDIAIAFIHCINSKNRELNRLQHQKAKVTGWKKEYTTYQIAQLEAEIDRLKTTFSDLTGIRYARDLA